MNPSKIYLQRQYFTDPLLKKSTCGICCIATVVSELIASNVTPIDILEKISRLQRNKMPVLKTKLNEQGIEINLTVGDLDFKINKDTYVEQVICSNYQPGFSLQVGYDHRISRLLFAEYGLTADYTIDINIEDFLNYFYLNKVYCAIASIYLSSGSRRHLVIVTFNSKEGLFNIVDPYPLSEEQARYSLTIEEFTKVFNGLATLVYKV